MKKFITLLFGCVLAVVMLFSFSFNNNLYSASYLETSSVKSRSLADCEPAQSAAEMNINNVRYLINMNGSIWWDLQGRARYEVPAGSGKNSLFAGALWIGGKDANNQLKLAAMLFGQNGNDYWPGPLAVSGNQATVSQQVCSEYDKFFTITRQEVADFRMWWACSQDPDCDEESDFPSYTIPDIITNWPAHGPAGGYAYNLAPWWDNDGDGNYNPNQGDFPFYEFIEDGITNDLVCLRPRGSSQKLFGDKTIWWVFNDAGGLHTETGGAAIGIEVCAQTFAFATNDAVNDMSFYNYNITNRSTNSLSQTYVGFYTDVDLGFADDDYIGCDVGRGLGYAYNADDMDESSLGMYGYGAQPPAVGLDFFEGPYKDSDGFDNSTSYDTVDNQLVLNCSKGDILNGNINGLNYQDGIIDNERLGMSGFVYYNGAGFGNSATIYPNGAPDFYNYLRSYWLDNTPMCYGGTGHQSGGGDPAIPTRYLYPGSPTSDLCGWGQNGIPMPGWSEISEGNPGGDRRFVMSSGPFTFEPGAVNDITIGVVWARATYGGAWASVEALRDADDLGQRLFENCFRIIDGPDAPQLEIVEMDSTLIFYIYNNPGSNNYLEAYKAIDPYIVCSDQYSPCSEYYEFQGYQVFQLENQNLSIDDRYTPNQIKQVFQCDVKDGVSQIVNHKWSVELKDVIPVIEVEGADMGIVHSFTVNKDMFASGSQKLVNNRDYYYTVIAYGYNNSLLYNSNDISTLNAQKEPYLAGENNIKTYKATPHSNDPQNGGTVLNTYYGFQPAVTMYEGHGNSNNIIELSDESIDEIMSGYPWKIDERIYKAGKGPLFVKVIDPLNVKEETYTLKFKDAPSNSYGVLGTTSSELSSDSYIPFNYTLYLSNGDSIESDMSVVYGVDREQLFTDLGISISLSQNNYAGAKTRNKYQNGFLDAEIVFSDPSKPWLNFVKDVDNLIPDNWIRVGTYSNNGSGDCVDESYDDMLGFDSDEYFENILGGTWAPYRFVNSGQYGFTLSGARNFQNIYKYEQLSSVDLVITSDKSKWTKCCVVELCENDRELDECGFSTEITPWVNSNSRDNAHKFALRSDPSVDKQGNIISGDTTHGMSWFPGYAIDMRTGRRLNIVFGEDSSFPEHNGDDMIWNPSAGLYSSTEPVFGGKHVIYIMGDNQNFPNLVFNAPSYDSCKFIYDNLLRYETSGVASTSLNRAWASAMWCAIPLQNPDYAFMATDVKIKLRVSGPYNKGMNEFSVEDPENDNYPMFSFSTIGLKAKFDDSQVLSESLDRINIVPNPYCWGNYYGEINYNDYVKLINLPEICNISIYSSSGSLVQRIKKNDSSTFCEWDMKDFRGKLISNGVYIIHIEVPGIGEKVLKWFGSSKI